MYWRRCGSRAELILCLVLVFVGVSTSVPAQGLTQSPYGAPSVVRSGLDLAPSNPLSAPVGAGQPASNSIPLTPQIFRGILPQPSNLQAGYLYSFGNSVGSGRLTLDFIQPVVFGNSAVFGEAHGEFQDFWKTVQRLFRSGDMITAQSSFDERTDLSFGGGYRTLLNENTLLGVNGFFDSTKLGRQWYSSGGVGFEYAALIGGSDAIDLTFNWYGNLFDSDALANAFRRGPQNYDFQAGYSHEMWEGGPDLRLSATGYRFSAGAGVYGFRTGAELKTRDGMFSVKYEAAHDRVNKTYHTVGGFVNVGMRLSNLLNGESPFDMPEPIFRSPRNLRRLLTRKVRRQGSSVKAPVVSADECTGRFKICGEYYSVGIFYTRFQGQIPFDSFPISPTYVRITWSGANESPQRYLTQLSVRSGDGTKAVHRYFDGTDFGMASAYGTITTKNQSPIVSKENLAGWIVSGGDLDLTHGCLCLDW